MYVCACVCVCVVEDDSLLQVNLLVPLHLTPGMQKRRRKLKSRKERNKQKALLKMTHKMVPLAGSQVLYVCVCVCVVCVCVRVCMCVCVCGGL